MADENKLVYPIGFNVDKAIEDTLKKLEVFNKKAQDTLSKAVGKSTKGAYTGKYISDVVSLKDNINALTKAWNKLSATQRVGTEGQRILAQFQNLKSAAGNYAGTLNQADAAQRKLAKGTATANKHFKTQSGLLMQLKGQMGAYLSIYALQRFAKNIRDITGEFELQRVALTAILQDKEAADRIYGQILVQALESPFRIKDIVSYTKQLAAYRVETDKLFETTKRLADVSAGLGVDMSRLVLAYGQVRAASVLRGQELRQFTEAGIPLVELLAEKFSELHGVMVSTGEVFELISRRAVPFRMIEEIFNDMTDAGGIFYDMQKVQAQTVHGVWMNLKDAYDKMYYEIGQKNMGLLKGLGMFLRTIADNWEAVFISIQAAVAGYIAYIAIVKIATASVKTLTAAQIEAIAAEKALLSARLSNTVGTKAATVASNIYAKSQQQLAVRTGILTRAFWKLTASMAANPWAWVIGAVVLAGALIAGFVIKANSLDETIKKLSKSTDEYNKINEEITPALNTYKKLNGTVSENKETTKELEGAVKTLAERYPAAITKVDEYGRAVEVSAEMVEKLMSAEAALEKQRSEDAQKELLRRRNYLESRKNALEAEVSSGYYTKEMSGREGGSITLPLTTKLLGKWNLEIGRIGAEIEKIDNLLKGPSKTVKDVEESLSGIKKYVFDLESEITRGEGGNKIRLYDAEEDVNAFGTALSLLEDIAKKYEDAAKASELYAKNKTNPKLEQAEQDTIERTWLEAEAEKELAYNVLKRYNALYLIDKLTRGDRKDAVDQLQDEVNVAKDARAAYEGYLRAMTEVRAKQTVENQQKFAGIQFDVSDAGSYKAYLLSVYENIKDDPNYKKVRQLIEDIFVDFDVKNVERELKNKLDKIANDIAKTQKANEFFEKILGLTGDIELSKKLTIKYTGVEAQETAQKIKEQLQMALRDVKGDDTLDITGMSLQQIQDLIDEIPDTASDKRSKVESFFEAFKSGGQDALFKMWELDNALRDLSLDDSALFGTGVTLDVQRIVRDLSVGNKKLALEKTQLEAKVAADTRASDKAWYDQQMKFIDDLFRQREANEKTLAQDKLNDLAKAYVEERMFQDGISDMLKDVGDKTYAQLSNARKMLQSISETQLIVLSDETMDKIVKLGYTLDDLMKFESLEEVFLSLGEGVSEADKKLLTLLFNMNALGLSAEEVEKMIKEILSGKVSNARVEELKKLSSTVNELSSGIAGILNDSLDLFGGDAVWVSGLKTAIDGFAKLTSAAVQLGTEIAKISDNVGKATSSAGGGIAAAGGGVAGAVIAIVGAFIQIVGAIEDIDDAIENEQISKFVSRIDAKVESLKRNLEALASVSGIGDGWFTEDLFNNVAQANKVVTQSWENLSKALDDVQKRWSDIYNRMNRGSYSIGASGGGIKDFLDLIKEIKKTLSYKGLDYDIIPDYIRDGQSSKVLDYSIDNLKQYINLLKDLEAQYEKSGSTALAAEARGLWNVVEQYVNALEGLQASVNTLVGDISGKMLKTVIDQWDEMKAAGIDAFGGIEGAANRMAESVKKDVAELIKDMVAQQLWAETMSGFFDTLGDDLSEAIIGGISPEEVLPIFDKFWDSMEEGLLNYATAWDAFLDMAEARGWNMFGSADADEFAPGSIAELSKQLSELEDQWDKMSQASREAAEGLQLWNDILAKKEELEAARSYYEYAAKLDEAVAAYDELIDRSTYLKSIVDSLAEGGEKEYAQSLLDKTNAEIFADLYSTYATDAAKYNDELANMQKHMEWAIENGYPELAEWIQDAYNTKVVDKWIEKMDEAAGNVDTDLDKWKLYVKEMQKTEAEWLEATMAGQDTTILDEYMVYLQGVLSELRKSLKDGIWSDYATDAQKFEKELQNINEALDWAIRNYPELGDEIADAFNTRVLEEWQDAWDEVFGELDTSFQKWQAIQAELASLGSPEITRSEAIAGRDAALGDMAKYKEGTAEYNAAKAAYEYYQGQLLLLMKINELLLEKADIENGLYNNYRSREQEYADDIAKLDADLKTIAEIRDSFAPDTAEWEKWNLVLQNGQKGMEKFISDYNLEGLKDEFDNVFGDISDMSVKTVKELLDAFREQILNSDLSEEAKKEALKWIDKVYGKLDNRTQQAFDNIRSALNSLGSLLETFGADAKIVSSFKGIENAIGGVAEVVAGVASGNWFTVLGGIAKLIAGFVDAVKSLMGFFSGDPLAGLDAIAKTVSNAQNAVEKAIGTAKSQEQDNLLKTYAQAIDKIDEAISSESGKKDTWWTRLLGTAPDKEAIEKLKEQREEYEKLMEEVRESMKADFLQTDYMSFSDALADILIRPWDSYMEMMDAVRELTDQTINDIVRHALSLQLQQQVNDALKTLYESGISDKSLDKFDEDIENIVAGYAAYQEALGKYFTGDVGSSTAYDTISRITEAQANSFLGYYQNFLIIMSDMNNVLKRIFDSMNKLGGMASTDNYMNVLQSIAANTAITARNTAALDGMASDIKQMKNTLSKSGAYS